MPLLSVAVPRVTQPGFWEWVHDPGDPPYPAQRGGSMTVAIMWLYEGAETLQNWIHQAWRWAPSHEPLAKCSLLSSGSTS